MKWYRVAVREVHVSYRLVKATDTDDAIERVKNGGDEEEFMEFSHSLSTDTWTVEEATDMDDEGSTEE